MDESRRSVRDLALGVTGAALCVVGVVLIIRPFESLSVLHWLVAVGLVLIGSRELATASADRRPLVSYTTGALALIGAVLAALWPNLTLWVLALVLGVTLIVVGARSWWHAIDGAAPRWLYAVRGTSHLIGGVLALSWPAATVLVLGVIAGIALVHAGVNDIVHAVRGRAAPEEPASDRRGRVAAVGAVVGLIAALAGAAVAIAVHRAERDNPQPTAFYDIPEPLPDVPPGTILRSEVIDGFHDDATTHRVLYMSTGFDGEPTAVSGLVLVPKTPAPPGGRKILAYAHGTVGVTPPCAPSLRDAHEQPLFFEDGDIWLQAGYVVATTDYQGLGTTGPHAYLIGRPAAMNELDIARAARSIADADAGSEFVVWGHSQGGHTSLFTGQLAAEYAPELDLVGVAAGGPVPDLIELFKYNVDREHGRVLIAMALHQWAESFPDATLSDIVTPLAIRNVDQLSEVCLYGERGVVGALPNAALLELTFLSAPPWEVEPWKSIAADNDPGRTPIDAPIMIVQGLADEVVEPKLTEDLAQRLCDAGETVSLHTYPGVSHIDTGRTAAPDVAEWTANLFAGGTAPSTCE